MNQIEMSSAAFNLIEHNYAWPGQPLPGNFTRNEEGGYSYVFKQPETPEEEQVCGEAMDSCPVEAIGNYGEDIGTEHASLKKMSAQREVAS